MRKLYFFAVFLVLYELAAYLANDMIMPGMIQVVHEFHASQRYVAAALNYYMLGNCALLLFMGAMAERYGKRTIMLAGNLIFLLFTVLIMFSQNIHHFVFFRFLEGMGLSVIAIGYALIHENFNDQDSVKLISLMGNLTLLAPLLGPVFGSLIVSHFPWRYVFVITAVISMISFAGLSVFTPKHVTESIHKIDVKSLIKHYIDILKDQKFLQGSIATTLAIMPILFWIGQAPNLVLYKLHQDYTHFVIYQLISIGGMSIASLLMQKAAGNYPIAFLVKGGAALMLGGLILATLGSQNMYVISIGFFVYTFGVGFVNGCVFRLLISDKKFSSNMLSSMVVFLQTLAFALVGMLENDIAHYFDYSLLSFTLMSLLFGIAAYGMVMAYIRAYRDRDWE